MRSMQVARFLEQQGFEGVVNVQGGIDAWSTSVDPTVPRY
jgi:rhodanese-related sulfurtransferase